jgi:hypothetical protein
VTQNPSLIGEGCIFHPSVFTPMFDGVFYIAYKKCPTFHLRPGSL